MKKILVLNGPNLNLLGTREPAQYGTTTLADVEAMVRAAGERLGYEVECFQSNWEGALIDKIHEWGQRFRQGQVLGCVFNPGAYTHTSVAIMDALILAELPVVEVHLSNIFKREPVRHHSYITGVAQGMICGFGPHGYLLALDAMQRILGRD